VRLGPLPEFVTGGPHNPMGARGMYLYSGKQDTLYRIHGTNQPEYIGSAVSSGCIRMTNEDAIDLYNRVKVGTPVVVLGPHQNDTPFGGAHGDRTGVQQQLIQLGFELGSARPACRAYAADNPAS
jgi:microcystin degradation protein MlrC